MPGKMDLEYLEDDVLTYTIEKKVAMNIFCPPGPTFFNDFTDLSYMKIVVIVELSAVLEPDNFWPRLATSHTDEDNFVA